MVFKVNSTQTRLSVFNVCVWQDAKPVTVVATNSVSSFGILQRNKRTVMKQYPFPKSIHICNCCIGGVHINSDNTIMLD